MTDDRDRKMELPEALTLKLREFEQRLRLIETVVAVMGSLCGILLTYGILFVSDRFWDTPGWLRAPLTLVGGGALGCFAWIWMHRWWWRRRNTRQLARLIQKQYRILGDRLLGAVELANGKDLPENISPALCRAAIRQVTDESVKHDFKKAVELRKPRIYSIVFLVLVSLSMATILIFPRAGWNAMLRWIKPLSPVIRYTFVSIEKLPDEQVVPHGEEFEISCRIQKGSRWRPPSATCAIKGQPRIETIISGNDAVFRIPGQTSPTILSVRIGDVVKRIRIIPAYRPELMGLFATVTPPSYLERPTQTNKIEYGANFLAGSSVMFEGEISRELETATATLDPTGGKKMPLPLAVKGNRFVTDLLSADSVDSCSFSWVDSFKLSPAAACAFNVTTVKDESPLVECRGVSRAIAILEDEVVELEIHAEDDFGLRELWVNWSSSGNKKKGISDIHGTRTIKKGSPVTDELSGIFTFSPIALHIEEETIISLYAYATDYLPGRKPSMSLLHRIYVLSRAQHSKLIQEQMEALQARIEDLAREEEDLLDKNKGIGKLSPEELASKKTTEALKESEQTEKSHASQLSQMADRGKELLKEALRNKNIPANTMAKWSQMVESMKGLASKEMKDAAKSLNQAKSSTQSRKEDTDNAVALEKKIVEELRKTEKEMDQSIKDMLAKSFINRLRASASTEGDIAALLQKMLPETVGVSPADLPVDKKDEIKQIANRQETTRTDVRYIQDDLGGFFNRTRIDVYNTINSEMIEKKTVEKLKELTTMISNNRGVKSIETATLWKDQLNAWADLLEKKMGEAQAQEGSNQQSLTEIDLEVLIALLRSRQIEESLRDQTRVLDESKKANRHHTSDSRKLAEKQNDLANDTRPLERKVRHKKLRKLIEKVNGEMMNAAIFLRRPQTDAVTIAIETEIIELLSSSIESCQQQCGAAAQMIMAAMGMGKGQGMGAGASDKGGGSNAGGTTSDPNKIAEGSADGDDPDARDVEKSGGIDISKLPEEFREAIEAYYNAVEEDGE